MLADFIELGRWRGCFSLGGCCEALYSSKLSIRVHQIWAGSYILTVVLNIVAGLLVREPLGLGGQEEAFGDRVNYRVYCIRAMQPLESSQVEGRLCRQLAKDLHCVHLALFENSPIRQSFRKI